MVNAEQNVVTTQEEHAAWRQLGSCPICNSSDLKFCCVAEDEHYGNPGRWSYMTCTGCGSAFLNPFPVRVDLGKFYPKTYYSFQSYGGWKFKMKKLGRRLLGVPLGPKDPHFDEPGCMLDIGCGSGRELAEFRSRGWRVIGVEPGLDAAEAGRKTLGLDIVCGTLFDAKFDANMFDYVRANHSLEHTTNPNEIFMEVFRILKPGGLFHIGVPNFQSRNARRYGAKWFFWGAPVHVFQFSSRALEIMASRAGFALKLFTFNSDYAGWLGSVQARLNSNRPQRNAGRGILFRNPLMIFASQRFADWNDFRRRGDVIEMTLRKPNPANIASSNANVATTR
jgi:SAM-dependent methyltransferase